MANDDERLERFDPIPSPVSPTQPVAIQATRVAAPSPGVINRATVPQGQSEMFRRMMGAAGEAVAGRDITTPLRTAPLRTAGTPYAPVGGGQQQIDTTAQRFARQFTPQVAIAGLGVPTAVEPTPVAPTPTPTPIPAAVAPTVAPAAPVEPAPTVPAPAARAPEQPAIAPRVTPAIVQPEPVPTVPPEVEMPTIVTPEQVTAAVTPTRAPRAKDIPGLPERLTAPEDPARFSTETQRFFEKHDIRGEPRFQLGRLTDAGGDPSRFMNVGPGGKVSVDAVGLKQELRATDPGFVFEEFETFQRGEGAQDRMKEFYRAADRARRGGTQVLRGEYAGDPMGAYTRFMENEIRLFTESQTRESERFLAAEEKAGRISKQAAEDRRAAHRNVVDLAKQQVVGEQQRVLATAERAESAADRALRISMAQAGFQHDTDMQEAEFQHKAGMQAERIVADRAKMRTQIEGRLKEARTRNQGTMPRPDQVATQRAKLISDRVGDFEKAALRSAEPNERAILNHNVIKDWNSSYFILSNPGVTNVNPYTAANGEPGYWGIMPDGRRVHFP
jgi:hypothetical protein